MSNPTPALTFGDYGFAVVAFFLSPLVSVPLCLYHFARHHPRHGKLYLAVLGLQLAVFVFFRLMLARYTPHLHS